MYTRRNIESCFKRPRIHIGKAAPVSTAVVFEALKTDAGHDTRAFHNEPHAYTRV